MNTDPRPLGDFNALATKASEADRLWPEAQAHSAKLEELTEFLVSVWDYNVDELDEPTLNHLSSITQTVEQALWPYRDCILAHRRARRRQIEKVTRSPLPPIKLFGETI
jgi:hypothetical protein